MADDAQGALGLLGATGASLNGALSSMLQSPVDSSRDDLAWKAGLLSGDGQGGVAGDMGAGFAALNAVREQHERLKAQYIPTIADTLIKLQQAQFDQSMAGAGFAQIQRDAAARGAPGAPNQGQPGTSGPGSFMAPAFAGQAPQPGQPNQAPQPNQAGGGLLRPGMDPGAAMVQFGMNRKAYLDSLLKDQELTPEQKNSAWMGYTPGMALTARRGEDMTKAAGMYFDPVDGTVKPYPGYAATQSAMAADKAGAVKVAENRQTLNDPTKFQPIGPLANTPLTVDQVINGVRQAPAANSMPPTASGASSPMGNGPFAAASNPAQGGSVPPALMAAVMSTESGGNPAAVSPKGAQGTMQVMPATKMDPGFGVTPAKDNSPTELQRVGQDYFTALHDKYQNPTLAAIAYNQGPGATDKWLANGADFSKLPAETKNYVASVMTKAAASQYQAQQPQSAPGAAPGTQAVQIKTPDQIARDAAQVQIDTKPTLDGATKRATNIQDIDKAYEENLNKRNDENFNLQKRNKEVAAMLNDYQTGVGGAETRTRIASTIKNTFPNNPTAQAIAEKINGGDVVSAQVIQNLLGGAMITNAISVLDGQGRLNKSEVEHFNRVAEGVTSDPGALTRIMSIQKKFGDQDLAEQQARAALIASGKYNPATWQAQWSKIRNDRYINGNGDAPSGAAAPSGQPASTAPAANAAPPAITQNQAAQAIKAQYAAGKMSREQAAKALQGLGYK